MSLKTQQDRELEQAPMLKQEREKKPITGLSPDDDLGGKSDDTGTPGGPMK